VRRYNERNPGVGRWALIFLVLWVLAVDLAIAHVTASRLWRRPPERATVFLLFG
jgi:hypothetical protein